MANWVWIHSETRTWHDKNIQSVKQHFGLKITHELRQVFVAFDEVVVFGIIHNQQCSGLLFFCFFMISFFSHKRKGQLHVSFPSPALSRYPLSFYPSYTTLCNNTSYYVSKDDITQFHWMLTSFHFPNAGLSEICVFLYTLGSLCSKSE